MLDESGFPKISLGFFPTPLVELPRLSKVLGSVQIYMKRDDQTGLALGGNKTRKLEYLVGGDLEREAIMLTVQTEGILRDPPVFEYIQ